MTRTTLTYVRSITIEKYLTQHPVKWGERLTTDVRSPTPAVEVFYALYRDRFGDLFTQDRYVDECRRVWGSWWNSLTRREEGDYQGRRLCGFYASCIDSLHVNALLHEHVGVESGYIDSMEDCVGKVDLTVRRGSQQWRIALRIGTALAKKMSEYKRVHRGAPPEGTYEVALPMERKRSPGNKRWYEPEDFAHIQGLWIRRQPEVFNQSVLF